MRVTKTYFTIMLRAGSYGQNREWYVEEFEYGNHLHGVHKGCDLVFDDRDDCIDEIVVRIKKYGGKYIDKLPIQGGSKIRKGRGKAYEYY